MPASDLWQAVSPRWLLAGVAVLVGSVYLPTLGYGFVYDDHWVLLDNGFLRDPSNLPALLDGRAAREHVPDAFRVAAVAFDLLAYQAAGAHAWAHHAINVLLHVATVLLLATWLRLLGASVPVRIGSAAIFGVMAVNAEAVSVVSYREDLLAASLGLAACVAASRSVGLPEAPSPPRAIAWALLAGLCMMLAASAKLSAAAMPGVWLAARVLRPFGGSRPRRRDAIVFALLVAAVLAVVTHRVAVFGAISPYGETTRVLAQRSGLGGVLAASVQIHTEYLTQLLVPHHLSPEHVDYTARWTEPATVLGTLAWVGLAGLAGASAYRRRRPLLAWVVLGAVLLALPTSNLAPMPNMRAERFLYLPSTMAAIGLSVILLGLGRWLRDRYAAAYWTLVPLLGFVVLQGAMARGASAVYRSDTRLWTLALRQAPHSARAHAVYGELLANRLQGRPHPSAEAGLLVRARTHCTLAQRLDPLDPLGQLCWARLAAAQQRWRTAYERFAAAQRLGPVRPERVWVAMASTLLDVPDIPYPERIARARGLLRQAQRENPHSAEVFVVSARVDHRLGHPESARDHYRRASRLRPERWDTIVSRLELELDLGHIAAARSGFREARSDLEHADPVMVEALRRRLDDARALFTEPTSAAPSLTP